MKNDALIRVYTRPLFDLAVEGGKLDAIAAELLVMSDLYEQVQQLSEYLDSPNVNRADKVELLKKAYDQPWSDLFTNFLDLVMRKGRQEILPFASEAFQTYWDELRAHLDVTVLSAVDLTEAQKKTITEKLSTRTGKNVELQCEVDPSILGGIRVQIGHQLLDGTVTGRLATLREELLGS